MAHRISTNEFENYLLRRGNCDILKYWFRFSCLFGSCAREKQVRDHRGHRYRLEGKKIKVFSF